MSFRKAVLLVLLAEIGMAFLGILNYDFTLSGLQATTRFSGRLSLLIFSLIFLFWDSRRIEINRFLSERYFLIFAMAHGIHLAELLSFIYFSGAQLIPYRLAGGFLAYAFIFLMPWIVKMVETGRLTSGRFSNLLVIYRYYVLFIFFMTYFSRVTGKLPNAGGTHIEHILLLSWVLLLLISQPLDYLGNVIRKRGSRI